MAGKPVAASFVRRLSWQACTGHDNVLSKRCPCGGRRRACGAWPGFEATRRAQLAARATSGRAGHAVPGTKATPRGLIRQVRWGGPATAHGHRSQASQALCLPSTRRRGARYGLGRGDQGIRMGPTQKGRPHCCRGIEPAGDVAATCHPGSWRRGSCRPWRPGRPARSRGRHAGRRWYGRSRKRGRQAASVRRRAGRRASCRPS